MLLRSKVGIIVICFFVIYGIVDFGIQRFIIFPSFVSLEREEAIKDSKRSVNAIQREIQLLDTLCGDWSSWDDTYNYIQSRSDAFIESNLLFGTFTASNLNLVYICDTDGKVIWGEIYDLETEEMIQLSEFPKDALHESHPVIAYKTENETLSDVNISGVFITKKGPMLIASRPILTSDDEGPIRGAFIMGRFLNDNLLKTFVDQTQVDFKIFPIQDNSFPEAMRDTLNKFTDKSPHLIEVNSNYQLNVYTKFPDIKNDTALLIRATIPRKISAKGSAIMSYALRSLFVAGFCVLVMILLILHRAVIKPITTLTKLALSIGKTGNLSARISMQSQDEIGTLANEFNYMLTKLEKKSKDLEELNSKLQDDINKRRQTEKALRESDERYRNIIERAPVGVFRSTPAGKFLQSNDLFAQTLGYDTPAQLIREIHNIANIYARPEQREEAKLQILKDDGLFDYEIEFRHKGGGTVQMSFNIRLVRDETGEVKAYDGFAVDITERVTAQKALQESEEKYRNIFESLQDTYYKTTFDGIIEEASPSAEYHTGYALDELIGQPVSLLCKNPEDGEVLLREMKKKGMVRGFELEFVKKNGASLDVSVNADIYYSEDGVPIGMTGTIRNITEKKELEAQLLQAQKMESIGTLAGGIAHDFNNILSPIIGYAEVMLYDFPEDNPHRNNTNTILQSAKRAGDLVKQILTVSRLSDQELKPLKVQLIIKEVLKLIRATLPSSIEIRQHISNKCGLVMADFTQVHQVAMNLMTNAFHAMEDEGGKLEVTLKEIELGLDDLTDPSITPGAYVCLTVADTGPGMERSMLDRIFDPYFTTKEKDKGTGLGLAVVHGIVKSYKGDIRVYSEPGEGTVFHVYLPVTQSELEKEEVDTVAPVQEGTERILLVDDEEPIVSMEKQMLERLGYDVTERTSSIEALETFRAAPDKFDLVITDMTMPNMTGVQLSQKLLEIRPDIPIIICTGFSEKINYKKAKALGIRGYAMKPVAMGELADKIREVLESN